MKEKVKDLERKENEVKEKKREKWRNKMRIKKKMKEKVKDLERKENEVKEKKEKNEEIKWE